MLSKKIGMLFTFLDSALSPQLLNGLYGEGGDGMSVLIRGMEMPEECNACPLANYNMGTMYCKALTPSPKGFHIIKFEGKREDCPLVEVKEPHGRLIDADETIRIWEGATIEGSIKPLIDARPTVIEAEGGATK